MEKCFFFVMDHTPYKSTGYTPIKDYFRLWILANFEELWFTVFTPPSVKRFHSK